MKITHHYKSIISALAALALFYSAAPRAGILDGGEIQFHGLVTDEAPKWTWQVGSPDQTWAVDTADARTESGQLVFDLRGKGSLPFLEGHLYEVAERGGPGFTPFITFSSNGQPFSVTAGGSTTAQHFRASVPVSSTTLPPSEAAWPPLTQAPVTSADAPQSYLYSEFSSLYFRLPNN